MHIVHNNNLLLPISHTKQIMPWHSVSNYARISNARFHLAIGIYLPEPTEAAASGGLPDLDGTHAIFVG